ncbi:DUF5134 domain-containing protein [Nocardioides luteus]|uniref:DUF5134 domain-containing protein n=1 Tax=Nocardioides luteus TaxID=1844 RepID=UPI0018CBDB03|nr:DUF5134 domain-containing protein [Nocardioides luteus]MBG6096672.1 membrane protein implicated in regulation of membrane protease activity [Nocardioides luteus]
MVDPPWDLLLTVAFVLTGTSGIWTLVVCPGTGGQAVLHVNHTVMSAAMILMIWVILWDVAVWAQVALFAILTVALLPALRRTSGRARRTDVVGHLALNAAMIWMLAAMPLLMADTHAAGSHTAGHAGHSGAAAALPTAAAPGWAIVVNSLFITACAAGVIWWLLRAAAVREHRLPALGHGLMATGMGTMLLLMPA